jgi:predicted DNA-binding ribbon-helix-helix protein
MQHRVIQHAGRRYSLKLEEISWQALEAIAHADKIRLNQLVARVAAQNHDANLTAALRQLCLERALQRAAMLERELSAVSRLGRGMPVSAMVEGMPAPCFALSQRHEVLRVNAPATGWIGLAEGALQGQRIDRYLQVIAARSLDNIVAEFGQGVVKLFPARIVCPKPGRLLMARGMICPALVRSAEDLAYLLMIDLRTAV